MNRKPGDAGFTLVELVMIIVILGILSATAYVKWPTGMKEAAAALELKQAVRYAQHKAMTRQYTTATAAWGLIISGNRYTVQRRNANCLPPNEADAGNPDKCAEEEYRGRSLLGGGNVSNGDVWFNGLGEPIDTATGDPISEVVVFTINGTKTVTVVPQTGYVDSP